MLIPFYNLSFSSDEVSLILGALDDVDLSALPSSRKQLQKNKALSSSASFKLSTHQTDFTPDELRVIYVVINLLSIDLSNSPQSVMSDPELYSQLTRYQNYCETILYKLKHLLLQAGIDIDAV